MKTITTPRLILFSLINLPLSMLMSPTAAILPNYYLEYSAVSAASLATVMLLMRLFDGVTDPLIGLLSDRLGKRKPLMIAGVLLLLASVYPLYQPPQDAGFSYLLLWYLLTSLGWTLVEIPHSTLAAAISDDYQQRNRVVLWRQMIGFAGGILFMAMPMILLGANRFTPAVFNVLAWVVIVGLPINLWLLWRTVPEYPLTRQRPQLADLWQLWRQLPLLRHFIAVQVLFGLATGGISGMFVIYASHYLDLGDHIAMVAMPMTLMMMASMPLWALLLKRVEKHHCWALSGAMTLIFLLLLSTIEAGDNARWQMQLGMTAIGASIGLAALLLPSMMADLIDYDRWRTGKDRGATLFAIQALVIKLNQGAGAAVALAIAAAFGFDAKQAVDADAALGLQLGFIFWPVLLLLPMLYLVWHYRLDRRAQRALIRALARTDVGNMAK
ncbi:MFS transporter [Ferrimonas senticii]|uniref:MFS transporter n=1 Tax=Ferrimonas senticii TaxID=394566 RepID=UPI0004169EFE|nr:MFS transporter [Ferrimonas senticii]